VFLLCEKEALIWADSKESAPPGQTVRVRFNVAEDENLDDFMERTKGSCETKLLLEDYYLGKAKIYVKMAAEKRSEEASEREQEEARRTLKKGKWCSCGGTCRWCLCVSSEHKYGNDEDIDIDYELMLMDKRAEETKKSTSIEPQEVAEQRAEGDKKE